MFCVHYIEPYQEAIVWNPVAGKLECQNQGGFHLTAPWVEVARIDLRPVRVCITSASRSFSCKLVQFEQSACQEFVRVEGFRYYWWANRISFNMGYDDEYRGMKDVLRGYAFSSKQYPFVKVLEDISSPQP